MKRTKAENIIIKHIENMNGLTNPAVACMQTPYAFSTCQRVFKNFACKEKEYDGQWFVKKERTG